MFFTCNVCCSLRLLQLQTEWQTILKDHLTKKLQDWNQNIRKPWVSLIGIWTTWPWGVKLTTPSGAPCHRAFSSNWKQNLQGTKFALYWSVTCISKKGSWPVCTDCTIFIVCLSFNPLPSWFKLLLICTWFYLNGLIARFHQDSCLNFPTSQCQCGNSTFADRWKPSALTWGLLDTVFC